MEKHFGGELAAAGVDERVDKLVAGERRGKAGDSPQVSQELEGFFDHAKMGLNGSDLRKDIRGLRELGDRD